MNRADYKALQFSERTSRRFYRWEDLILADHLDGDQRLRQTLTRADCLTVLNRVCTRFAIKVPNLGRRWPYSSRELSVGCYQPFDNTIYLSRPPMLLTLLHEIAHRGESLRRRDKSIGGHGPGYAELYARIVASETSIPLTNLLASLQAARLLDGAGLGAPSRHIEAATREPAGNALAYRL